MTTRLDAAQLRGIFPALPTPVRADDSVDADAARKLMRHVLPSGIGGVVPIGGTGEYGSLPGRERVRMVAVCAEEAAGKIPVIAGVLDPGFHDALAAGRAFAEAGCDLVDVSTGQTTPDAEPVYGRMFQTPFSDQIRNDAGDVIGAVGVTVGEPALVMSTTRASLVEDPPPATSTLPMSKSAWLP